MGRGLPQADQRKSLCGTGFVVIWYDANGKRGQRQSARSIVTGPGYWRDDLPGAPTGGAASIGFPSRVVLDAAKETAAAVPSSFVAETHGDSGNTCKKENGRSPTRL